MKAQSSVLCPPFRKLMNYRKNRLGARFIAPSPFFLGGIFCNFIFVTMRTSSEYEIVINAFAWGAAVFANANNCR